MTPGADDLPPLRLHRRIFEMNGDLACFVVSLDTTSGPLAWVSASVDVDVVGATVIMLSLSDSMAAELRSSLQRRLMADLLEAARAAGASPHAVVSETRKRLWEIVDAGTLHAGLPSVVVLSVSPGGEICASKVGPMAVAVLGYGLIQLLHPDDRFAALERMGVDLGIPRVFDNPLLRSVTCLYMIEPDGEQMSGEVPRRGAAMLFSGGAYPFPAPSDPIRVDAWNRLEAGRTHGMNATVASVYWKDAPPCAADEWSPTRG